MIPAMNPRQRTDRAAGRTPAVPHEPIWIGGRLRTPFYIAEGTPYRPDIVLWIELPSGAILGFRLAGPAEESRAFGDSLLQAIASPLVGPPRRPGIVRVADAALVEEVQRVLPGARIEHAPTPELDEVVRTMAASMPGSGDEKPRYVQPGRIGPDAVAALFRAAAALYPVAPWEVADDDAVLRVDIPALGIDGACLSVIGALGESLGFLLFPSVADFESFCMAAEERHSHAGPVDLGTTMLALNYEAASDLPPTMRREATTRGWPVADSRAYPVVEHRDRDGVLRPLTGRDLEVVTAIAVALAAFFVRHGAQFVEQAYEEPISESFVDAGGVEVRFTMPPDAGTVV